jgi:hypothetical protein
MRSSLRHLKTPLAINGASKVVPSIYIRLDFI